MADDVQRQRCVNRHDHEDVDRAVAVVKHAIDTTGMRAHVAVATSDNRLYRWMLLYEARCAEIGVRLVRVFRQCDDAERWLDIVSAARNLQSRLTRL